MSYPSNSDLTPRLNNSCQLLRFSLGIIALILGSLIYLIERPARESLFIAESISLFNEGVALFGPLGNHLPTFIHPFAFILITASFCSTKRSSYWLICSTWLTINTLFEIGQHSFVYQNIISHAPPFLADLPFMDTVLSYFKNGHFDPFDILSIFMGVIAAYGVLLLTEKIPKKSL